MAKRLFGKINNFKKNVARGTLAGFLLASSAAYALPVNSVPAPEKKKSKISLILRGRKGFGNSKFSGVGIGLSFLGKFGLVGRMDSHPEANLKSTEEQIMGNVSYQGNENRGKYTSIGGAFEVYLPVSEKLSWVIGAGASFGNYNRELEEKIVRSINGEETLLSSNKSLVAEKEIVGDFYTGPSIKLSKRLEFNINFGYKTPFKKDGLNKGAYISIGTILSFPGKQGDK